MTRCYATGNLQINIPILNIALFHHYFMQFLQIVRTHLNGNIHGAHGAIQTVLMIRESKATTIEYARYFVHTITETVTAIVEADALSARFHKFTVKVS